MQKKKLVKELEEAGCDWDAEEFRDLLIETWQTLYPAWSIDELLCHPSEALKYVDLIRRKTNCKKLAEVTICRHLMNPRKHKALAKA